jgi:hypothetical protein
MHPLLTAGGIAGGALAVLAGGNYWLDPAHLFAGKKSPLRGNTRLRKMEMLAGLARSGGFPQGGLGTLVLGSSRCYNLGLVEPCPLPQPLFNFGVSSGCSEDFLAGYRFAKAALGPPRAAVLCVEPQCLHPHRLPDWEALVMRGPYAEALLELGALRRGPAWPWPLLLSPDYLRHGVADLTWRLKSRQQGYRKKFRWEPNGVGTWTDDVAAEPVTARTRRQISRMLASEVNPRDFPAPGQDRVKWLNTALAEMRADGVSVVLYAASMHPALRDAMHSNSPGVVDSVNAALSAACSAHGATFRDWHDPAGLGFTGADYRDAIHPRDHAQARIAEEVAKLFVGAH